MLVPFYVDEALPGDTFNLRCSAFARLATPIKPFMDNLFMETFFFSVPIRQVWENWEKFNGEQTNPADSTDFIVPQITWSNAGAGSVTDYFGLPPQPPSTATVNGALFFRAYSHIYNNWFRDQNLIDSTVLDIGDGPDSPGDHPIQRRRKRPDYFTSCLPWPQKGDPITVPIAGTAPVTGIGLNVAQAGVGGSPTVSEPGGAQLTYTDSIDLEGLPSAHIFVKTGSAGPPHEPLIFANLAAASGISISDLRQSFQIQKLMERDARGGTRYPEILKSHFGVSDPQMLVLQRPEFLGGGSTQVNIHAVEQTTETDSSTPQGNLAAVGTASFSGHGFTKSFTEHCILIGIINIRADLTYQQGVNRMFDRKTRFDFYWPALSHLSEQAVLQKEIFLTGGAVPGPDSIVFGYQERYAEYRYKPSIISGQFRSTHSSTLDVWHLSQEFASAPVLDKTFIEDQPPIPRVIAVPSEPEFLLDAYFSLRCARPMPLYGVPGLIDHF